MAGPARTATPIPRRSSTRFSPRTLADLRGRDSHEMELSTLLQKAFDGKLNVCGTVALATTPTTTTDIDDARIGTTTVAWLQPLDSGASAEYASPGPPTQAVNAPGKIRLTHSASASTRTFAFVLFG
jgi:hypothetical protein